MLKKKTLVELVTVIPILVELVSSYYTCRACKVLYMLQLVLRVICRACIEFGYCYLKYYVCFLLANIKYEEFEPNRILVVFLLSNLNMKNLSLIAGTHLSQPDKWDSFD